MGLTVVRFRTVERIEKSWYLDCVLCHFKCPWLSAAETVDLLDPLLPPNPTFEVAVGKRGRLSAARRFWSIEECCGEVLDAVDGLRRKR